MNDSVMAIATELYKNPELLQVMKLCIELSEQDRQNILTYIKNTKKVRNIGK